MESRISTWQTNFRPAGSVESPELMRPTCGTFMESRISTWQTNFRPAGSVESPELMRPTCGTFRKSRISTWQTNLRLAGSVESSELMHSTCGTFTESRKFRTRITSHIGKEVQIRYNLCKSKNGKSSMSLREYIRKLSERKELIRVQEPISRRLEISGVLKKCEPAPVLFDKVRGSAFPVVGNLFCSKKSFADYFGIPVSEIIPLMAAAIENHSPCEIVTNAPCQEVILEKPDLDLLPILFHCDHDGGNYISSGVFMARHPQYGQNADFHRCMQFSKTEMAVRVVRNRHFDRYLRISEKSTWPSASGMAPMCSQPRPPRWRWG